MQEAWHALLQPHQQQHLLAPLPLAHQLPLHQGLLLPAALRQLQHLLLPLLLHLPAALQLLLCPKALRLSCWQQQLCLLQL
jgi:hypothetical protein